MLMPTYHTKLFWGWNLKHTYIFWPKVSDACSRDPRIPNRATSTNMTHESWQPSVHEMSAVATPQLSRKINKWLCQIAKTGFSYDKTP